MSMSFSRENIEEQRQPHYGEEGFHSRTPSPGKDYTSLLYENFTQSDESQEEYPYYSAQNYVQKTLSSLEADTQRLAAEIGELKTQNNSLRSQLEFAKREKEMHIKEHAKDKNKWQKDLRELQERLSYERHQFRVDFNSITKELQDLQKKFEELKKKKKQQTTQLQTKLAQQEKEHKLAIKEKDRQIHFLEIQLEKAKTGKPPELPRPKPTKNRSKKVLTKSAIAKSPRKKDYVQEITQMIVGLEREQAELTHKVKDLEYNTELERERKKLEDLIKRNQERLYEAKAIQKDMIRDQYSDRH